MQTEFQKGQYVVYAANGVCSVEDVCKMPELSRNDLFYVLRPASDKNSVFYIPVTSETLTAKIRTLLSKEEIDSLIDSLRGDESTWIEDRKARMEHFRDVLRRSDPRELLLLAGTVYAQKQRLLSIGKKLSSSDESVLRQAESITDGEFSYVLGVEPKEVGNYILHRLSLD